MIKGENQRLCFTDRDNPTSNAPGYRERKLEMIDPEALTGNHDDGFQAHFFLPEEEPWKLYSVNIAKLDPWVPAFLLEILDILGNHNGSCFNTLSRRGIVRSLWVYERNMRTEATMSPYFGIVHYKSERFARLLLL